LRARKLRGLLVGAAPQAFPIERLRFLRDERRQQCERGEAAEPPAAKQQRCERQREKREPSAAIVRSSRIPLAGRTARAFAALASEMRHLARRSQHLEASAACLRHVLEPASSAFAIRISPASVRANCAGRDRDRTAVRRADGEHRDGKPGARQRARRIERARIAGAVGDENDVAARDPCLLQAARAPSRGRGRDGCPTRGTTVVATPASRWASVPASFVNGATRTHRR
jgi:hypothetical protein